MRYEVGSGIFPTGFLPKLVELEEDAPDVEAIDMSDRDYDAWKDSLLEA